MDRRIVRHAGWLALCYVTVGAQTCQRAVTVIHHYELSACPESSFAVGDRLENSEYSLRRNEENAPMCRDFTRYKFMDRPTASAMSIRLNRGRRCTLDVAYEYVAFGPKRAGESDRWPMQDDLADVAAQLALHGSPVIAIVPAKTVTTFDNWTDVAHYCRKPGTSADSLSVGGAASARSASGLTWP